MEEKTDMMPQKPLSSVIRSARCRARMREKWPVSEESKVFCLSVEVRVVVVTEVGVVGTPFLVVLFDMMVKVSLWQVGKVLSLRKRREREFSVLNRVAKNGYGDEDRVVQAGKPGSQRQCSRQ